MTPATQTRRGQVLWGCWQLCTQVEREMNRALRTWGLSAQQAHVLLCVLDSGEAGTSLTAIHRQFGVSMGALSTNLKHLRQKGLVRSEPCAGDDRCKRLFPTPEGQTLRAALDKALRDVQQRSCRGLSWEELDQLSRLQSRLGQNLARHSDGTKEDTKL